MVCLAPIFTFAWDAAGDPELKLVITEVCLAIDIEFWELPVLPAEMLKLFCLVCCC